MKAFVLAGGLGTRLRPQFGDLPKPLAPLAGRPVLAHQVAWLVGRGITEIVLLTGHGGEQVEAALGDGAALGARLHYSHEVEPLGTGGALKQAEPWVDGPALVLNADTLLDLDPWVLERARWEHGAVGAIALFAAAAVTAGGRVECDAAGRVTRFVEKDASHAGPGWMSGGAYAFAPALWRALPAGASSLERDVLPGLAGAGALVGHRAEGGFHDIGTPEGWARADRDLAR